MNSRINKILFLISILSLTSFYLLLVYVREFIGIEYLNNNYKFSLGNGFFWIHSLIIFLLISGSLLFKYALFSRLFSWFIPNFMINEGSSFLALFREYRRERKRIIFYYIPYAVFKFLLFKSAWDRLIEACDRKIAE